MSSLNCVGLHASGTEIAFMKRNRGAPATARPRAGVATIDIVVASRLWTEQRGVKALLRRAIREAASATSTLMGEIAIVLTDDSAIRSLNRHRRGQAAP